MARLPLAVHARGCAALPRPSDAAVLRPRRAGRQALADGAGQNLLGRQRTSAKGRPSSLASKPLARPIDGATVPSQPGGDGPVASVDRALPAEGESAVRIPSGAPNCCAAGLHWATGFVVYSPSRLSPSTVRTIRAVQRNIRLVGCVAPSGLWRARYRNRRRCARRSSGPTL
jgi:hypothetical protein